MSVNYSSYPTCRCCGKEISRSSETNMQCEHCGRGLSYEDFSRGYNCSVSGKNWEQVNQSQEPPPLTEEQQRIVNRLLDP